MVMGGALSNMHKALGSIYTIIQTLKDISSYCEAL